MPNQSNAVTVPEAFEIENILRPRRLKCVRVTGRGEMKRTVGPAHG